MTHPKREMAKRNDGAPGIDGVTFEAIEAQGVEALPPIQAQRAGEPGAASCCAYPVTNIMILTTAEEFDVWTLAPWEEASQLQRPLPQTMLRIVASGEREDPPPNPIFLSGSV